MLAIVVLGHIIHYSIAGRFVTLGGNPLPWNSAEKVASSGENVRGNKGTLMNISKKKLKEKQQQYGAFLPPHCQEPKATISFLLGRNSAATHKRYFKHHCLPQNNTGNINSYNILERHSKCSHCQGHKQSIRKA